jgi:hypothetical protein
MNQTCERSNRLRAAAEPKKIEAIGLLIVIAQKFVSAENITVEAISGCQPKHGFGILF